MNGVFLCLQADSILSMIHESERKKPVRLAHVYDRSNEMIPSPVLANQESKISEI